MNFILFSIVVNVINLAVDEKSYNNIIFYIIHRKTMWLTKIAELHCKRMC